MKIGELKLINIGSDYFPMIKEVYVNTDENVLFDKCIVFLAGRSQQGKLLADIYKTTGEWTNTVVFGVTPQDYYWYPMPAGVDDQWDAIEGLPEARRAIEKVLSWITTTTAIPRCKTILVGFSAGGVMALEVGCKSNESFKALVCHSGAILNLNSLPFCQHSNMPVLLTHSLDDDCFEWQDRYLPMKKTLVDQGYNVHVIEREFGGHELLDEDSYEVSQFMKQALSRFEKL